MKLPNLRVCLSIGIIAGCGVTSVSAAQTPDAPMWKDLVNEARKRQSLETAKSPLITRSVRDSFDESDLPPAREARSIDGTGNNEMNPQWGAADIPLERMLGLPAQYGDSISTVSGSERPGARLISNIVSAQEGSIPNSKGTSDFIWQWGQFLDHDIDLTEPAKPVETMEVTIPADDEHFQRPFTMKRSIYQMDSFPRAQLNEITAFIDASMVYGSSEKDADDLRMKDGGGKLRTSHDGLFLPYDDPDMMPNELGSGSNSTLAHGLQVTGGTEASPAEASSGDSEIRFQAGDARANEQVGLTVIHTLFVREHNRLASEYFEAHPEASDEEIYQYARRIVVAEVQRITYKEFLPLLLGENALSEYQGYRADVNPSILNSFSTAAYRFGHSALSPRILRLDASGNEIEQGHLSLREAFFCPSCILEEGGIEPVLRGLAAQYHQTIDIYVVDDVRNFLFGQPGSGGLDLASLNIMRGRDHGLPSYVAARSGLGLGDVTSFDEISSDPIVRSRLESAYAAPDKVDLWVGGLAEDPVPGSHMGITFQTILVRQFTSLRDGDRFFYENEGVLTADEMALVRASSLAQIIRRNTDIGAEIQDNVFVAGPAAVQGEQNSASVVTLSPLLILAAATLAAG